MGDEMTDPEEIPATYSSITEVNYVVCPAARSMVALIDDSFDECEMHPYRDYTCMEAYNLTRTRRFIDSVMLFPARHTFD